MSVLSAGTGVSVLALGIHYAVLAAGLVGLLVLLVPQMLESRRLASGHAVERGPRDEHEARVQTLRAELAQHASGSIGVASPTGTHRLGERPTVEVSVWLPLAVVGSVGAAVVPAAVCPDHFHEKSSSGALGRLRDPPGRWAFLVARGATPVLTVLGALANFVVVVTCVLLARRGLARIRMAPLTQWNAAVRVVTRISAVGLVALSLSGIQS